MKTVLSELQSLQVKAFGKGIFYTDVTSMLIEGKPFLTFTVFLYPDDETDKSYLSVKFFQSDSEEDMQEKLTKVKDFIDSFNEL